jgi:uncharacterized membrane protein
VSIEGVHNVLAIVTLSISILGALVVVWGVIEGIISFVLMKIRRPAEKIKEIEENEGIRRQLGGHLLLGLEIFIGADIISSVVSPAWDKVGMLAVIVVIRTILSYFLKMELKGAR